MYIASNFAIVKKGEIFQITADDTTYVINADNGDFQAWSDFYMAMRTLLKEKRGVAAESFFNTHDGIIDRLEFPVYASGEPMECVSTNPSEEMTEALDKLINFFKEFEFEPNFRFVNTLSFKVKESQTEAINYIRNYFALVDNSYKTEINAKIKSLEFKDILKKFAQFANPASRINQRFAVYFGSAGTGKTTLAMQESGNRCIVCNASMLPSDLMEDFVFESGKPTFQKSALWNCMEKGQPIVLDEINLLPFDSLRFLQGVLDGKKEFDYKGHKVEIADGFKVIGTMNLSIGGMIYGLPEPLIDRCADMRQFSLTASQLLGAVL